MDDRLYRDLAVAIASGLIVYFLIEHHIKAQSQSQMPVETAPTVPTYNAPQSDLYNPSLGLQPINITIGNQGLNYLDNKTMPMFGFVGMANGIYQQ